MCVAEKRKTNGDLSTIVLKCLPLLYTSALLPLCILTSSSSHTLSFPFHPSTSSLYLIPPPPLSPHLLVDVGLLNEGVEHVENTVYVPHLVILPQDLDLL